MLDYRRGLVVGDSRTHGKGSVQQILELAEQMPQLFPGDVNAGALKLTLQMFYRVNGDSTQLRGVPSDIVLPAMTDRELFAESRMDFAMEFDQIKAAEYVATGHVSDALVKKIRQLSEERRRNDPEYAKYAELTARRLEVADRKSLVFNLDTLRQQKKDLGNEDEDDDEDKPEPSKKKDEKFAAEPYTREVAHIAADLIRESAK